MKYDKDFVQIYEPINTLKEVAKNIWVVDGSIVKMSMYRTNIPFSTRMTIIKLNNGGLWCHSPIELTTQLKKQIDSLGKVDHLISPNKIHYAHINSWSEAYPKAISWASPGVKERAAQQNIIVNFNQDLVETSPVEWADEIEQLIFKGSRFMEEVVFFHRQSRTLILADLIENFEPNKLNFLSKTLTSLAGCLDPDGKAPLDLRMTFFGNKKQARKSWEKMMQWQPEKIILAHGRWYNKNGMAELERAFRWLK